MRLASTNKMEEATSIKIVVHASADLAEIVPPYLENRRRDIAGADLFGACPDLELARSLGHKMKGTGTSFGLTEVSRLGAELEAAAKRGDASAVRSVATALATYLRNVEVVCDAAA